MIWTDDDNHATSSCDPYCPANTPERQLNSYHTDGVRATFIGDVPVVAFSGFNFSKSRDLLYVSRLDGFPRLSGLPPELAGGWQCFDGWYFDCTDVTHPSITPDGDNWIAAYVAQFTLRSWCIGVRWGLTVPDTCLTAWGGITPHDPEIVLVNGEPFVLWAERSGPDLDLAQSARFDPPSSSWIFEDFSDLSNLGFVAGAGLTWRRIRAVSDGAVVTALYERSDGRLVARSWNGSWHDAGVLAAAGASSSDIALYQGVPHASFVLDGHVHVTPIPEPAPGALTIVALGALAAVARRRILLQRRS